MSETGYIYLSLAELSDLILIHLISGVDEDDPMLGFNAAIETSITGYTEWISEGREISIGWDWQMLAGDSAARLIRISLPSSNVMLQSPGKIDLGPQATARLLSAFIDEFDWQTETLKFISVQ